LGLDIDHRTEAGFTDADLLRSVLAQVALFSLEHAMLFETFVEGLNLLQVDTVVAANGQDKRVTIQFALGENSKLARGIVRFSCLVNCGQRM